MKVFDWKVRGDPPPELETIYLGNLKRSPGSKKRKTRKGRGISAGQGKTCGFGDRGQKSRSGHSVRPGFEGGQTPLHRRLPKYVGRPMGPGHQKTVYDLIKVSDLNCMPENSEVDFVSLLEARAVRKAKYKIVKVVGGKAKDIAGGATEPVEPLTIKGLTVKAHSFTKPASAQIEANGGTCVWLSKTTNKPLSDEDMSAEFKRKFFRKRRRGTVPDMQRRSVLAPWNPRAKPIVESD